MPGNNFPHKYWWLVLVVVPIIVAVVNNLPTPTPAPIDEEIIIRFDQQTDQTRIREVIFSPKEMFLNGEDWSETNTGKDTHYVASYGELDLEKNSLIIIWDHSNHSIEGCWERHLAEYRLSEKFVTQMRTESVSLSSDKNCTGHETQRNNRL